MALKVKKPVRTKVVVGNIFEQVFYILIVLTVDFSNWKGIVKK